jgi:hypothetical protein
MLQNSNSFYKLTLIFYIIWETLPASTVQLREQLVSLQYLYLFDDKYIRVVDVRHELVKLSHTHTHFHISICRKKYAVECEAPTPESIKCAVLWVVTACSSERAQLAASFCSFLAWLIPIT